MGEPSTAADVDGELTADCIFKPSHMVKLSPIINPPSTPLNNRRLSSQFSNPTRPILANTTTRKMIPSSMAWVSLQGRLVGAEEASSARAIGGGLSREEAFGWELFSPIHRVLIVAVVAVAASKCEKNRQIVQLKKCVLLRDEILMSMQQKLDDLCEQMNCIKDQPQVDSSRRASFPSKSDSICTDCWLCGQGRPDLNDHPGSAVVKAGNGDEMFGNRLSISNEAEAEERRMSDLSDWASSVTSAADIQLNNLAMEQDTYNLKRECEEKDAAITELSAFIRSKDVATAKRIEELEEVIRRKNTIINKLKKDLIVLEQKVISLTRTRRRSFSGTSMEKKQTPILTDNVLYDMDSPTSPFSSDSDCSSENQKTAFTVRKEAAAVVGAPLNTSTRNNLLSENVTKRDQKFGPARNSSSSPKLSVQVPKSRPVSPLKENSLNQRQSSSAPLLSNQLGSKNYRRRTQSGSKDAPSMKRWL